MNNKETEIGSTYLINRVVQSFDRTLDTTGPTFMSPYCLSKRRNFFDSSPFVRTTAFPIAAFSLITTQYRSKYYPKGMRNDVQVYGQRESKGNTDGPQLTILANGWGAKSSC
mmetsp:Transcript_22983/g.54268  ORF Transcript_22983/g.54268 Transcript_22983/m.54268 type:complete len:112 (+) Transcript_22983:77-412(+)